MQRGPRLSAGLTVSCFASVLLVGVCPALYSGNLTAMAREFGWERGQLIGSVNLMFGLSFLVTILAWTIVNQNCNRKWALLGAVALTALGFAAPVFGKGPTVVMASCFLLGAATAGVETVASTLLGEISGRRRALLMGVSQSMFALGVGAGPFLIVGLLSAGWSWRASFGATAAAGVVVAALLPPCRHAPTNGGAQRVRMRVALSVLRERRFLLILVCMCSYVGVEAGLSIMGVQCLEEIHLISSDHLLAKVPITAFWLAMVPGRLIAGAIADRWGESRVITACLALGLAAQALFLVAPTPVASIAAIALAGLGLAGVWPTIVSGISRTYADFVPTRVALAVGAGGIGIAVFLPVLGWVYDAASATGRARGVRVTLLVILGIGVLSLISHLAAGRDDRRRASVLQKSDGSL